MSELLGFSFFSQFNFQRISRLALAFGGNLGQAWCSFDEATLRFLGLRAEDISKIIKFREGFCLEKYRQRLADQGISLLDIYDPRYPNNLKNIYDPPILLYAKGDLGLLNNVEGLAVVGTRRCSQYGRRFTQELIKALGTSALTIVSGMASGIDTVAHATALEVGLPTVAVVGTGLDLVFPPQNNSLFNELTARALVLSEFCLGSQPEGWRFPRRNRIVTGLAKATVVVEGNCKSGALISGKIAMEQGRDVYALPGQIYADQSEGTNWLISEGATPILSVEAMVELLVGPQQLALLGQQVRSRQKAEDNLSKGAQALLSLLNFGEDVFLDDLIEKAKLDNATFSTCFLELELSGFATQLPGSRVVRI